MKKAVIYARFSCSNQTEQSIEGQIRVCKEYAQRNNIVILNEYIDRAKSGTNDSRPSFQKMIKDSQEQDWDYILVYKLDRFSRDKYDSAHYKHLLKDKNIRVISATENIPDTPESIIFESVLEGFAQYYSAELSQKVKRGLKESYIKGNFTGGFQLFGYDVVDHKNVINEFEANIVREIFTKFSKGFTVKEIADNLVARDIKTKRGNTYNDKTIFKMLGNEKYIGKVTHQGEVFLNVYPRIIDDNLWNTVSKIRERNRITRGENVVVYGYILSKKVYCGYCKRAMIGGYSLSKSKRKYGYYACRRSHQKGKCDMPSIPKLWLEENVLKHAIDIVSNTDVIDYVIDTALNLQANQIKESISLNILLDKRKEIDKQINNLMDIILKGSSSQIIQNKLNELEKEQKLINHSIEIEKNKLKAKIDKEDLKEFFKNAITGNILEDTMLKRIFIKTFIKNVIVFHDKVVIVFNYSDKFFDDMTPSDVIDKVHEILDNIEDNSSSVPCVSHLDSIPPRNLYPHSFKIYGKVDKDFFMLFFKR